MTTQPLEETDYLKAWAIFWLISTAGSFIVGMLGGAVLGGILGAMNMNLNAIRLVCGIFGFLLGIPVSYFSFRLCITKFIVPKVKATHAPVPPPLPVA